MIIIGSCAALLGGFLPAWREGRPPADLDIVCTAEDAERIAAAYNRQPTWHWAGAASCYDGVTMVDMSVQPAEAVAQMAALCGPAQDVDVGHVVGRYHIAPLEVVWATLYATAGGKRSCWDKSVRDLLAYDEAARAGGRLTQAHHDLALACRERQLTALRAFADQLLSPTTQEDDDNAAAH